jgi:hypothetical protein
MGFVEDIYSALAFDLVGSRIAQFPQQFASSPAKGNGLAGFTAMLPVSVSFALWGALAPSPVHPAPLPARYRW